MINLERMWKEAAIAYFRHYFVVCLGWLKRKHENPVRIAGLRVDV
jgi:hypothetical protein